MIPDLKKEQKTAIKRPRYRYSLAAKVFFFSINLITGKKITLSKVKLIEILASIPYHMNMSFALCDKTESIVAYDGMPAQPQAVELLKKWQEVRCSKSGKTW
jgi:hypothetical protein